MTYIHKYIITIAGYIETQSQAVMHGIPYPKGHRPQCTAIKSILI